MESDNGILGRIPPEFISRAPDRMPDPNTAAVGDTATAIVNVLELSEVKSAVKQYCFWTVVQANRV